MGDIKGADSEMSVAEAARVAARWTLVTGRWLAVTRNADAREEYGSRVDQWKELLAVSDDEIARARAVLIPRWPGEGPDGGLTEAGALDATYVESLRRRLGLVEGQIAACELAGDAHDTLDAKAAELRESIATAESMVSSG